jgi:hypothetical protein
LWRVFVCSNINATLTYDKKEGTMKNVLMVALNKKVNFVTLLKMIALLLLLSIAGCYQTTQNIKVTDDLSGKKVLAGRFLFYENDTPLKDSSPKFIMFYHRQGDKELQALEPDRDGYIYIPATSGRYIFDGVKVIVKITEVFNFSFSTLPVIDINDSDSLVNFGTLNVKLSQSVGEKVVAFLVGLSHANISLQYVPDHDVTRQEIVAKIGASIPLKDVKVMFFKRAKKTEKTTLNQ